MTLSDGRVRPARPEDDEGVRELARRCGLDVDPKQQRDLAQARLWVASLPQSGEVVAGFVLIWIVADEAELIDLGVDPGMRRRGLARALVDEAQTSARRAGVRSMFLEVRESNEAARSLYEALGFEICGRRRGYYGDGEDALLYSCCLSDPV